MAVTSTFETRFKHCIENGIFTNIFKGAGPSDGPTRQGWDNRVAEALDLIQGISPDLRLMVDLLVTDLVVLNSGADGGGSASHIPGVVVMSPGAEWDVLDYAMCLVHEGMHLNLFVADKVYGTFTLPSNALEAEERRVHPKDVTPCHADPLAESYVRSAASAHRDQPAAADPSAMWASLSRGACIGDA